MVLDKLGDSLRATLQKIAKSVFVDERLIDELAKDIQRALLQADTNVELVLELTKTIKDRALKEKAPPSISQKEHIIKIVYEELVKFLGKEERPIEVSSKPTKIMLVGLFGSGKTTTAGKLAKYFTKRGHKVALLQTDTWRAAAYEQLKQLGESINVPVYGDPKEKDALKVYNKYENEIGKYDVVIIDSAGRDALSEDLIRELNQLAQTVRPTESLLVLSADIGQAAEKQAKAFHDACKITGVITTKLEGTAKGGGALISCSVTGAPVRFIGVGEKIDDLEPFNPKGFVGRLLGMGDLQALLEKAKDAISEEQAEDLGKRLLKGDFNLLDLYEQMEAMSKMGPLSKVVDMIPGFTQLKLPKDMISVQEGKLKKWRYAMDSMTKSELEEPDKFDSSRIERVAKGAGVSASDIRDMLKQYKQAKKMMKMMKGGSPKQMQKMMKRFGVGGLPGQGS